MKPLNTMNRILETLRRMPPSAIFAIALLLRMAWIVTLEDKLVWPDEQEFGAIAEQLAAGNGYVSNSYRANPVVPVYLAAFFKLFGLELLAPRIGQAILGAATCVLLARLTATLAGPVAGTLAGLMLAIYPAHIYLSGVFYVACIATFLSTLGIWLVVRVPDSKHPLGTAVTAGVVLGLTALTRATFLAYLPLAPIAIVWAARSSWRSMIAPSAALFAVSLAVVVPWSVRNSLLYERPMLISSGLWETLWKGNNELSNGGPDDRNMVWQNYVWNERVEQLEPGYRAEIESRYEAINADMRAAYARSGDMFLARDETLRPVVIGLIAEDPIRIARLFGIKVLTLFDAFSDTEKSNETTTSAKKLVAALSFYPILAFALVGIVMVVGQHRRYGAVVLYVASFVFVYGALTACTRFRLPVDPFLMLFAAVALERLAAQPVQRASWQRSRRLSAAAGS